MIERLEKHKPDSGFAEKVGMELSLKNFSSFYLFGKNQGNY